MSKIGVRLVFNGKKLYCYVSYKKKTNRFRYYLHNYDDLDREIEHVKRCIRFLETKGDFENKGLSPYVGTYGFPLTRSYNFSPNSYFGDYLTYNQFNLLKQYSQTNEDWFIEFDTFLTTINIPFEVLEDFDLHKDPILSFIPKKDQKELSLLIYTRFFEEHYDIRLVDWYTDKKDLVSRLSNFISKESSRIKKGLSYSIWDKKIGLKEVAQFVDYQLDMLDQMKLAAEFK